MWISHPRITRKFRLEILALVKTFGRLFCALPDRCFSRGYLNKFSDPMSIKAEIRSAAVRCCLLPQAFGFLVKD
jgi:hypothetical protein